MSLETPFPEPNSAASLFSKFIRKRTEMERARRAEALKKQGIVASLDQVLEKYKIRKAFLFGSVLRGSTHLSSDIDLYVEEVSAGDYWTLWRELEEAAQLSIDLYCQLDDPVFVKKIKKRGRLIYESGH
jgi:predicted nucleotidyltransferase